MIMNLPDVKTFPDNPVDVTTKQCRRHNQMDTEKRIIL